MRFPVKFLIVFNFVLPLLAAFAIARVKNWRAILPAAIIALATIAGIVWFARTHPVTYENWNVTLRSGLSRALLVLAAAALLWLMLRASQERRRHMTALVFLALLAIDGITHSPKPNPTISSQAIQPGLVKLDPAPSLHGNRAMLARPAYEELVASMISDPTKDYLLHRQGLSSDCNLLDGLAVADGFFSLYLREQRELWVKFWVTQTNATPLPFMDFLSVAHVNAKQSIFDWTNRATVQPLATIGRRPIFANEPETLDALVSPSFNPSEIVYLLESAKPLVNASTKVESSITAERLIPHRMEYDVTAKGDTVLVLAQSFYKAWHATVDGKPTPILRANCAFQAVAVPAGAKTVVFEYRDDAFRVGVAATILTFLAGVALWFAFQPKNQIAPNTLEWKIE